MSLRLRLLTALVIFFVSSASWAGEAPIKLRVAYPTLTAGYAVAWVTKEEQIFKKNGLDVELLFIQSSPILVSAMLAGDAHIGLTSGTPTVASNIRGSDLVLVASVSKTPPIAYVVTSPKITSPAQLKGKILGIDRLGGTGDFILRLTLRKFGIDPDKDVTIRQVGQSPIRLAALQAGAIDGTTITVEDKFAAERFGLNILVDIPKLGIEVLYFDVVTTKGFLKKEEEAVRRFMKAMVEGVHFYKTHKAKSMEIMARYMRVKDLKMVEAGYDFNARTYNQKPYPFIHGIQLALEQLAQSNPAAKEVGVERFFDAKLVKELDESGFIDGLYK